VKIDHLKSSTLAGTMKSGDTRSMMAYYYTLQDGAAKHKCKNDKCCVYISQDLARGYQNLVTCIGKDYREKYMDVKQVTEASLAGAVVPEAKMNFVSTKAKTLFRWIEWVMCV
jgi:hypothetical protein